MKSKLTILALAAVLLTAGAAGADQIRLRSGDLLQGEVIGDRSNDDGITIRLYRTGGVFSLRWDQMIKEDENRIRDMLGLTPWDETDVPLVPGTMFILINGTVVRGIWENAGDRSSPVRLRTDTGVREYPWDTIAENGVRDTMIEALEVYTPEELAEQYLTEAAPTTPAEFVELGKQCVQVEAYRQAKEHFDAALADEEYGAGEQATIVRNLLARVEVFLKAEDGLAGVREAKRLRFQKRFDESLGLIAGLRTEYEDNPAILELLNLDRLERQVASDRRTHFQRQVRRRFFTIFDSLVNKKVREKDDDDRSKDIGIKTVTQWATNPRGLVEDIFGELASQTGLDKQEAREFWDSRSQGQVRRYNYGQGTFIHPDVASRVAKALRPKAQRNRGGSSRMSGRNRNPRGNQQQVKLKTADDWWNNATSKEKRNFIRAWFAESGNGILEVLRIESELCRTCGGKGVLVSQAANSAEEIRTPCPACNMAGHRRIVICR